MGSESDFGEEVGMAMLSPKAAAMKVGVSTTTMYRLFLEMPREEQRKYRLGRKLWRIRHDELLALCKTGRLKAKHIASRAR